MHRRKDEMVEVDLSPLIDCVFLLLIFFLVTTMLKKLEKQIPVTLPDYTTALAPVAEGESVAYLINNAGVVHRAVDGARSMEGLRYVVIDSFEADLQQLAETRGREVRIRIDSDREVPVQRVIDVLDTLAFQGFENVGVRLRHREREFFELR